MEVLRLDFRSSASLRWNYPDRFGGSPHLATADEDSQPN
jgi:hypothetical protein